ncbi:MAG TPA: hypothetical protein VF243_06875, partial [Nitrosospira sp.]
RANSRRCISGGNCTLFTPFRFDEMNLNLAADRSFAGEQTLQSSCRRKPVSSVVQSASLLMWAGFRVRPGMTK